MHETFDASYFDQIYRNYARQNPARKLTHYRDVVERFRSPTDRPRIHDVGCAFGYFLGFLPAEWSRHGSDLSEHAIGVARGRTPTATYEIAPAFNLAPPTSPYDIVTAFDVLEHEPQLDAAGDAILAQLQPGGLFVFVVPVYDGLSRPVIRALDPDPTHIHKWPRDAWLTWAARRFTIVMWEGILRYLLPGGYYLHLPMTVMRRHTPAILVVCRRD